MPTKIEFYASRPAGDRIHHISGREVRVVLSRLPAELYCRLRTVHFNDQARGARVYGYVTQGHREIALCALPPRVSFTRALVRGQRPSHFGAVWGHQWPSLAIRRFLLYDVFLHELGHLQVVDENRPSRRLRFAREKLAQEFADAWRRRLWSSPFDHPDHAHNPPGEFELACKGTDLAWAW